HPTARKEDRPPHIEESMRIADESPQLQALRSAILASPADDAPRLAYADACEEVDQPYAEFIRAFCAMEREESSQSRRGPFERIGSLWKEHGARWTEELEPLDEGSSFSRGFVNALRTTVPHLLDSAKEVARHPLERMWLADSDLRHLDLNLLLPLLARLQS